MQIITGSYSIWTEELAETFPSLKKFQILITGILFLGRLENLKFIDAENFLYCEDQGNKKSSRLSYHVSILKVTRVTLSNNKNKIM